MEDRILNIGLTGNSFSGKKRVGKLFSQLGIPVFNADVVLKFILTYKENVNNKIKKDIGDHLYTRGFLDPIKIVDDKEMNKILDAADEELFKAYKNFKLKFKDRKYCIFLSSIIYEREMGKKFDYIINVFSPLNERIERYKRQTNKDYIISAEHFNSEMDQYGKNTKSDYVIHNYMGQDINSQVDKTHNQILIKYFGRQKQYELYSEKNIIKNITM